MTQSTAMHAERGETTGAHLELCHCPPEQTESRGSREREAVEKLVGRPSTNWRRRVWQSDRQCTITLVFRFGPSEHSFWTQLRLNVSSRPSFFSPLFWSPLQWKYIPVMPHCCSLFRFLITNSITRMGWSWPEHKPGRGRGPQSSIVS